MAARKAAIDCANAADWLLQVAAGKGWPAPAEEKRVYEQLGLKRWDGFPVEPSDPIPIILPIAVNGLCKALASGWGLMYTVREHLIREAPGPASSGGMIRACAHELAWDFARHLWLSIRDLDIRLDPQWEHIDSVAPRRFDLDAGMVQEYLLEILAVLSAKPPFGAARAKALILHESVRAIVRLESAGAGPVDESPAGPPVGSSPSFGSDRPSDRTEAAAEQPARRPEGEPAADPTQPHRNVRQSADELDEDAIADALAALGYQLEAVFVRHFKGRQSTTWQDLVKAVCGDEGVRDWNTVKTWVNRVKNALREYDRQCRLSFSTSSRDFRVIKRIEPE
jgi:hypothetical protein